MICNRDLPLPSRFMETSAKASQNVEEAFYILSRDIKAHIDKKMDAKSQGDSGGRNAHVLKADSPKKQNWSWLSKCRILWITNEYERKESAQSTLCNNYNCKKKNIYHKITAYLCIYISTKQWKAPLVQFNWYFQNKVNRLGRYIVLKN